MKMKGYSAYLAACGVALCLFACQQVQFELLPEDAEKLAHLEERMDALEAAVPDEPEGYTPATYEHFVTRHAYPRSMTIYHDDAQMARATAENAHVVICLFHQRGRLYVDGQVVADWPVSTGVEGRATTPGEYKVREKKKDHASRRFGVIKSASGKTLVADADSRKHKVPAGAVWEGSPMPNWMRLTDYGMGMHTGVVKPGTCLSHGCIRMPDFIASRLFDMVEVGWRVVVVDELEADYPAGDALMAAAPYNAWLYEKMELEREIKKLKKAAEKRAKAAAESQETQEAPEPVAKTPKPKATSARVAEPKAAPTPSSAQEPAETVAPAPLPEPADAPQADSTPAPADSSTAPVPTAEPTAP